MEDFAGKILMGVAFIASIQPVLKLLVKEKWVLGLIGTLLLSIIGFNVFGWYLFSREMPGSDADFAGVNGWLVFVDVLASFAFILSVLYITEGEENPLAEVKGVVRSATSFGAYLFLSAIWWAICYFFEGEFFRLIAHPVGSSAFLRKIVGFLGGFLLVLLFGVCCFKRKDLSNNKFARSCYVGFLLLYLILDIVLF